MPHQETLGRVEYLKDYSSKDRRWDSTRASADVATSYFEDSEYARHAERCRECARRLTFNVAVNEDSTFKLKLKSVYLCHVRMCPVCQVCRTRVWNARFDRAIPLMIEANPTVRFLVLTLTVKNCPIESLRDTLQTMSHAFSKMMKRSQLQRVVLGYARSMEVTKGKDGSAHPHFHVLLAVKPAYFGGTHYINHDQWMQLWKESLQIDYDPVVDVRVPTAKKRRTEGGHTLTDAIREIAKYTVKVSDLLGDGSPESKKWFITLVGQLHAVKQMNLSGLFRTYLNSEDASPEEILTAINEDDGAEVETTTDQLFFQWFKKEKHYARFVA
jgi:plasmid rolling circle replication initiator protein Rep